MRLLALSGNTTRPSRTRLLVEAIAANVASRTEWEADVFDLLDAGPALGATLKRQDAGDGHLRIWNAMAKCDALVVGSGVYKASYAGLLKHLFDIMEPDILMGKPVALTATAKSTRHHLMIEHQFRPLFAFFGALTLPTSIFATDADFDESGSRPTPGLSARIETVADELAGHTVRTRR